MYLTKIAISLTLLGVPSVFAQDPFAVCNNPSVNDEGDYIEQITSMQYCLNSDPVPNSLFVDTPLNFLTKLVDGFAVIDLGAGYYVYGDATYMGAIVVYEKDCKGGSKKQGKRTRGKNGDKGIDLGEKGGKRGEKGKKAGEEVHKIEVKLDKKGGKRRLGKKKKGGKGYSCDGAEYGAILIDAPPNFGDAFGEKIKGFLDSVGAELEVMIVTHEHYDHVGQLNSVLDANPTLDYFITSADVAEVLDEWATGTFKNPRVNEIFRSNANFPQYQFDLVIEEEYELTMGNQTLQLRPIDGHVAGNILVWHEASYSLLNIDTAVFPKWSPFFNFAKGTDVFALFKKFEIFAEYPYKYYIGGHTTHIGTPEDVLVSEEFAADLLDAGFRAFELAAANPTSTANLFNILTNTVNVFAGQNAGNGWLAFNEYLNQITVSCAKILLDPSENYSGKQWVDILVGVRSTVYSHCATLASSLRIDVPGGI